MSIHFAGTELKRFRVGTLPRVAILVLLFIPLIYGALYLWGFWNPFGELDKLPVALVNEDAGAKTADGTAVNAGDQVVDKLVGGNDLSWREVDAEEAANGVKDGTYYFSVTIPKDFSKDVASAAGDDAQSAELDVRYNDSNSYLASLLGSNAMVRVRAAVAQSTSEATANTMIVGIDTLANGTKQAASGATQVAKGATSAHSGARQLTVGLGDLADGTVQLADGTASLQSGAGDLASGADAAASGSTRLAAGARALADGTSQGTSGAKRLASGAEQVSRGNAAAAKGAQELSEGARALANGTGDAKDAMAELQAGSALLNEGIAQAQQGTESLNANAKTLASGASRVSNGISGETDSLHAGLSQMYNGANGVPGMKDLPDSAKQLADGSAALEAKIDPTNPNFDETTSIGKGSIAVSSGARTVTGGIDKLADNTDEDSDLAAGAAKSFQQSAKVCTELKKLPQTDPAVAQVADDVCGEWTEEDPGAVGLAKGVSDGIGTLHSSIVDPVDGNPISLRAGAAKVADGATKLKIGVVGGDATDTPSAPDTSKLTENLWNASAALVQDTSGLPNKVGSLAIGIHQMEQLTDVDGPATVTVNGTATPNLAQGAQQVSAGATKLQSQGTAKLLTGFTGTDGQRGLAQGGGALQAGLRQMSAGADQLNGGAQALASGSHTLADKSGQLASGSRQVAGGAGDLAAGSAQLNSGAQTLAGKTGALADGLRQLDAGAQQAVAGTQKLAAGAHQANRGAQQAHDGAGTLTAGTQKLSDGAGTLATKLTDGADRAPTYDDHARAALAKFVGSPVGLNSSNLHQAYGFGEGFAPFFFALATFVGALITWLILRPLPTRPLASNVSGLRSVLAGYLPSTLVGLGQVLVMMTVIVGAIGLTPVHLWGTAAFTLLVALAFLAFQQMLIVAFGAAPGRVIALILLMLQLVASGGAYPIEVTPRFFQVLQPFAPATYVVNGLREMITGGVDARFWWALAFLSALLAVSLAISAACAEHQKVWTLARLHPELTI